MGNEQRNEQSNTNACMLAIGPLASIIENQIAEESSLGIKCVSLLEKRVHELKARGSLL